MSDDHTDHSHRRILLAVLVYNGRNFVPDCLRSLARVRNSEFDADVLVLDDCSPEPGWSDELRSFCESHDMAYYRSPRNLGIPRNMNLALLKATEGQYDYVVLLNSDLVLPVNFLRTMVKAARSDVRIGSVTAWSNNASIFSLPHKKPPQSLGNQVTVDWLSNVLEQEFDGHLLDIPAAVGFCMLIPNGAIRSVGLFDPIFGRGYCEEVDWSLRSKQLGFRNVLVPSTFVYHFGSSSTRSAGLLAEKDSTVPAHEAIIDWRFPNFRKEVEAFLREGALASTIDQTHNAIIFAAARQYGYCIDATSFSEAKSKDGYIWFLTKPNDASTELSAGYMGFNARIPLKDSGLVEQMNSLIGCPPQKVQVSDRGQVADTLIRDAAAAQIPVVDRRSYPELI